MKKVEKYKETVEKQKTVSITCDFCLKDMNSQRTKDKENEISDTYDWEGQGDRLEADVRVEIRLSNSYYDCGSVKEITLDVCPVCFKTEILNRSKNHTSKESDW